MRAWGPPDARSRKLACLPCVISWGNGRNCAHSQPQHPHFNLEWINLVLAFVPQHGVWRVIKGSLQARYCPRMLAQIDPLKIGALCMPCERDAAFVGVADLHLVCIKEEGYAIQTVDHRA
jgi:hypothetical protein